MREVAPAGEFALIDRFFRRPAPQGFLGVGDDCALIPPGSDPLAVSTDTLVAGRHFFPDADPRSVGHKSLAVNLSDLAAMGAEPVACLLAIALPDADERWLVSFSSGFLALAERCNCPLVGGDTVRMMAGGPLTLTVTVLGRVPADKALRRDGARAGDDVWVSGHLGDAALALACLQGRVELPRAQLDTVRAALDWPEPRLALGRALRGVASAGMDLSDGLSGDILHLLRASGVGACLEVDRLPVSPLLRSLGVAWQRTCSVVGGDDYELLFTAAPEHRSAVIAAGESTATPVTRVGRLEPGSGLRWQDGLGNPIEVHGGSFDHFRQV